MLQLCKPFIMVATGPIHYLTEQVFAWAYYLSRSGLGLVVVVFIQWMECLHAPPLHNRMLDFLIGSDLQWQK